MAAEVEHRAAHAALSAAAIRRAIEASGRAEVRIRGRSMWPVFRDGDSVELRAARADEPLRGAIVAIDGGERVVVHRVVGESGDRLRTHGVARRSPDPETSRAAVLGVVSARRGRVPVPDPLLRLAASLVCAALGSLRAVRRRGQAA